MNRRWTVLYGPLKVAATVVAETAPGAACACAAAVSRHDPTPTWVVVDQTWVAVDQDGEFVRYRVDSSLRLLYDRDSEQLYELVFRAVREGEEQAK